MAMMKVPYLKGKDSQNSEHDTEFYCGKKNYCCCCCITRVPRVPVSLAIIVIVLNCIIPGLGTMIVGCVPHLPREEVVVGECCCYYWLGIGHFVTMPIIYGYVAAIIFGVQLLYAANRKIKVKKSPLPGEPSAEMEYQDEDEDSNNQQIQNNYNDLNNFNNDGAPAQMNIEVQPVSVVINVEPQQYK